MDDSVVIALFRHGVTADNEKRAYAGWLDSPLSINGKKQLEETLGRTPAYQMLFASDLRRCIETSQYLFPNGKPLLLPEFRELNFGNWEGKTHVNLENDEHYQKWLEHPFTTSPPDGESFSGFTKRVENGWKKMKEEMTSSMETQVSVVTHGGVIRYLLSTFAQEKKDFWEWEVPHGKGFEMRWSNFESFRRGERCTLLRAVPLTENPHG